jgi:hypothetical protein
MPQHRAERAQSEHRPDHRNDARDDARADQRAARGAGHRARDRPFLGVRVVRGTGLHRLAVLAAVNHPDLVVVEPGGLQVFDRLIGAGLRLENADDGVVLLAVRHGVTSWKCVRGSTRSSLHW